MITSVRSARAAVAGAARLACGALAFAVAASCGARSSLRDGGDGAGGSGAAGVGVASSSSTGPACACDDGIDCTVDLCADLGCEHVADDAACDDGLVCTVDICSAGLGCSNPPSDAACDDGIGCTIDACDAMTNRCRNEPCDTSCNDGLFCNGVERCDSALGCTSGPAACTLGLGCETSSCAEATATCSHALPPGCVPPDVHLLVTDAQGSLWDVAPYASPSATLLVPSSGVTHLDIAVLNGRWFALDGSLVELEPGTNQVIAELGPLAANSLAGGPDGKLYAAGQVVTRVDPDTGAQEIVGALPAGHSSSGDIAFLGARMFVSTDSGCGGALIDFDPAAGTGVVLGGDGLGCVYGLAAAGGELFVLNCDGQVGTFDPDTGQARIFSTTSVQVFGADRLP